MPEESKSQSTFSVDAPRQIFKYLIIWRKSAPTGSLRKLPLGTLGAKRTRRMSPVEIEQTLRAALGHHQAGQRAQAEALYNQILNENANQEEALHGLGVLAIEANQVDSAVEFLRRAAAIQPMRAEYQCNLGF